MFTKVAFATVDSDGNIQGASQNIQAVSHQKKGIYDIVYKEQFNNVPAANATQLHPNLPNDTSGSTKDNAVITYSGVDRITVKTGDGSGDASNRWFSFIAVE